MIKLNAGRFRTLMHSCRLCLIHECGVGAGGVKSGEREPREKEEEDGEVPQVESHPWSTLLGGKRFYPSCFHSPPLYSSASHRLYSRFTKHSPFLLPTFLPPSSLHYLRLIYARHFSTPVIVLTFYYSYFMHSHLALSNQKTLFLDFFSTSPYVPIILIFLHTHTAPPTSFPSSTPQVKESRGRINGECLASLQLMF